MAELGPVDVGLIPIWGWGPGLGRAATSIPRGRPRRSRCVRPRVVVPIHWGTYFPIHLGLRGAPALRRAPAGRSSRPRSPRTRPDVELRVLRPGESVNGGADV